MLQWRTFRFARDPLSDTAALTSDDLMKPFGISCVEARSKLSGTGQLLAPAWPRIVVRIFRRLDTDRLAAAEAGEATGYPEKF